MNDDERKLILSVRTRDLVKEYLSNTEDPCVEDFMKNVANCYAYYEDMLNDEE